MNKSSYNAYFISDIHLKSPDELKAKLFLDFLKKIPQPYPATHLFLLGDIFDLWISNHEFFIHRFDAIVHELSRLVQQGISVHYVEGNHDLYLRDYFENCCHIHVYESPEIIRFGHRMIRIEHGDQIDRKDHGYCFLRWLLRTRCLNYVARHLPGHLVAYIGTRASQVSRSYNKQLSESSYQEFRLKIRQHALDQIQQQQFDFIISGHFHVQDIYAFQYGKQRIVSINLGSWDNCPQAFRLTEYNESFMNIE
ncbi:MAG: UDP-2,3-diacylglucosamine diphosphatase [Desulfobacterales bacterium]|nr:UDP-2,3-diacylglucosamine diphosphatase [Desulfobacterales bacterium]